MSRRGVIALASGAAALGCAIVGSQWSYAVTERSHVEKVHVVKDLRSSDAPLEEQPRFRALERYLADALHQWEPHSTLQEAVAHDITRAVLDPGEEPLFDDSNRARTAVLLASVEHHEGTGRQYVDSGLCNDPREKDNPILKNGSCDGGAAVSLWQVHPGRGIVLFDNGLYGYKVEPRKPPVRSGYTGGETTGAAALPLNQAQATPPPVYPYRTAGQVIDAAALHDRAIAAKVALHMLRASLKRDGTLCEYSGEVKPCPKAAKRLKFAVDWSREHPFIQ